MICLFILTGCSSSREYVVSEPISGGLSKSVYDIDCSTEIVTYSRKVGVTND